MAGEVFTFRLPLPLTVALEPGRVVSNRVETLRSESDGERRHVFGNRLVVSVTGDWPESVEALPAEFGATATNHVSAKLRIYDMADAWAAARAAARIAELPGVAASYPVVSKPADFNGRYAPYPADDGFQAQLGNIVGQWHLENRALATGAKLGPDLNVRAAWPMTRGKDVTIAIADTGIELSHPDLVARAGGAPHWNFASNSPAATPAGTNQFWAHGTAVAGLAAATTNDIFSGAGVAPEARLASWVINDAAATLVSDDKLAEMFSYASNVVSVQNHSWSGGGVGLGGPTALEWEAIDAAVTRGRQGLGVVMVRSAGNDRERGASANDDGYASDPRVVAVGSVNRQGRWASYSEPGSSILIAAPSGETGQSGLFTTDLTGPAGFNAVGFIGDPTVADYAFNIFGFSGTSASAPLISGVAALILGANPALPYQEVQQVLALSARHYDFADPTLQTNQAGFVVSDRTGFGVPDAGEAVRLALAWVDPDREVRSVTVESPTPVLIPDGGLRLVVTGEGVTSEDALIVGLPTTGAHPDVATPWVRLVDAGLGTNYAGLDVAGKAVLVERGTNDFGAKLDLAHKAGAVFAIIYNFAENPNPNGCPGGDQLCLPGGTDTNLIAGLFVGRSVGLRLKGIFATNATAEARLELESAVKTFSVEDTLVVQKVGVRVQTDHPLRGDLRLTLVSPAGTRSILQRYNADISPGPIDWTYWSTHHLGESSAGDWRLEVTDEFPEAAGQLLGASLQLVGSPIVDTDRDGLDDVWEEARLQTLAKNGADDSDGDGSSNAREQVVGTDPMAADVPFLADLSIFSSGPPQSGAPTGLMRLSWPATTNRVYQVLGGTDPGAMTVLTNLPGKAPEMEWFVSRPATHRFFQVRIAPE